MQSSLGRNESKGQYGAWHNQPSSYAAESLDALNVVNAINFTRVYNLRFVIKVSMGVLCKVKSLLQMVK